MTDKIVEAVALCSQDIAYRKICDSLFQESVVDSQQQQQLLEVGVFLRRIYLQDTGFVEVLIPYEEFIAKLDRDTLIAAHDG